MSQRESEEKVKEVRMERELRDSGEGSKRGRDEGGWWEVEKEEAEGSKRRRGG